MAERGDDRRCRVCGARLARDNPGPRCGPCVVAASRDRPARDLPPAFWFDAELQAALRARHMGRVIKAYRQHGHHGRRGLSQELVAGWAGMSQAQLSRMETGPAPVRLDQLVSWARLLGVPEHHLWFSLPASEDVCVDRPAGLDVDSTRDDHGVDGTYPYTVGLDVEGGLTALLDRTGRVALPDRVGRREIEQVGNAAVVFEGWDFAFGGGVVREAVMAQLRWSVALLDRPCPSARRRDLMSAVGYLAHTCAFMAFDDLANGDATRVWRVALACAEHAADWPLRATILSAMARQAMWLGRYDDGLTLADLAMVRADRLTVIEQAKLHATRARLLAMAREPRAAREALDAADDAFDRADAAEVPPWMAYYDVAEHAGDTGHALSDLAVVGGSLASARERLDLAIDRHTTEFARSEALCRAKLATLLMAVGDPYEAAEQGMLALDRASVIWSRRLDGYLQELAAVAGRHAAIPVVTVLLERLADRMRT
jgi:hypothetical protein